jgi:hypothetical protein
MLEWIGQYMQGNICSDEARAVRRERAFSFVSEGPIDPRGDFSLGHRLWAFPSARTIASGEEGESHGKMKIEFLFCLKITFIYICVLKKKCRVFM